MAAVAKLKAVLGMDTGQYRAGMRGAKAEARSFQKSLAGIGRAMGAAFSVSAIVAATKSVVAFASEIRHAADNLEIGTDAYQALTATALKYGMSSESVTKALSSLGKAQGEVIQGSKEYIDELDALGVAHEAFARASKDEALELIAKGYAAAEDRAAAFAAVTKLVGRAGKEATAFLEELADEGLKGVEDAAKSAGQVLKEDTLTKLEQVGTRSDQIARMAKVKWGETLTYAGGAVVSLSAQARQAWDDMSWVERIANLPSLAGKMLSPNAIAAGAAALAYDTPSAELKNNPGGEDDPGGDEASRKAVAAAMRVNERLRGAMKEGLAKINHDHAVALRDLSDARKKAEADDNAALSRALDERRQILERKYSADVEAFTSAEREKLTAAEARRAGALANVNARAEDRIAALEQQKKTLTAYGRGTAVSNIARIGGSVGAHRPGLGAADRQLKLAEERTRINREILDVQRETRDEIRDMTEKIGSGGVG